MSALAISASTAHPHASFLDELSTQLTLIPEVLDGFGVVPITGDGSVLLQRGEVAVYDESWRQAGPRPLRTGLYCIERQRGPSRMPNYMLAQRFIANDPVQLVCEREVVGIRPSPHVAGAWDTISLRSKIVDGARRYAAPDGPWNEWGLIERLLGPVVGIYAPRAASGWTL